MTESTKPATAATLEQYTIAAIPESERHGRPRDLFTIWFSSNIMPLTFSSPATAAALVVSLGIDTYELDPICDLAITTGGCQRMGRLVVGLELPAIIVQEGGYYVPKLGDNVREWLRGFLFRPAGADCDPVT